MSKNLLTGLEQKVIHKITEKSWLKLATDLIRCGQPASGNALDPDLPSGEEIRAGGTVWPHSYLA